MTTNNPLPTRNLCKDGPQVPRLGLGFVSFAGTYGSPGSDAERLSLLDNAYEMGATFWDTGQFVIFFIPLSCASTAARTFKASANLLSQPMSMAMQKTSSVNGLLPTLKSGKISSSVPNSVFETARMSTRQASRSIRPPSTVDKPLRSRSTVFRYLR